MRQNHFKIIPMSEVSGGAFGVACRHLSIGPWLVPTRRYGGLTGFRENGKIKKSRRTHGEERWFSRHRRHRNIIRRTRTTRFPVQHGRLEDHIDPWRRGFQVNRVMRTLRCTRSTNSVTKSPMPREPHYIVPIRRPATRHSPSPSHCNNANRRVKVSRKFLPVEIRSRAKHVRKITQWPSRYDCCCTTVREPRPGT